jgi:hydroxymethylpyrimidine pyrophosphatase-like HAD family hydrolase
VTLPRLVATDLDGTLIRSDQTISARTVAVLEAVATAGTAVVLVTGRPIRWLPHVYERLSIRPLAVCVNGAAVYDPVLDAVVGSVVLTPAELRDCCARLRAVAADLVFAVERDGGRAMRYQPGYPVGAWEVDRTAVRSEPLGELLGQPAAKLLARRPPDATAIPADPARRSDELVALARAQLAGLAEATHSSNSGLIEISAAGVTKASGLAWVADRLGVPPADVVAFGDMPNDLPMLAWAGRGVAMANGHRAVLAAADEVTGGHDEDGVARYLQRLLDGSISR